MGAPSNRRVAVVAVSCLAALLLLLASSEFPLTAPDASTPALPPSPFDRATRRATAGGASSLPSFSDGLLPPVSLSASATALRLHAELRAAQAERLKASAEADEASLSVCQRMLRELGIEVGVSWGTATGEEKNDWWLRDCDAVLGLSEYRAHLQQHPLHFDPIHVPAERQSPGPRISGFDTVAICVEHADVGYEYWLYLLYDAGDPFLDQDSSRAAIQRWFDEQFIAPLESRDIASRLVLCRYNNSLRKPGPAFNYLTHLAFIDGADWLYRINDDSKFATPFAFALVSALTAMGPPYGVAGPVCNEGAQGILTHDFTHRTHHLIFFHHYPQPLSDWWMDDWITRVYGKQRTARPTSVVVVHLTKSHGTRYAVNLQHKLLLGTEVEHGRQLVERYMADHEMAKELDAFVHDEFKFYV